MQPAIFYDELTHFLLIRNLLRHPYNVFSSPMLTSIFQLCFHFDSLLNYIRNSTKFFVKWLIFLPELLASYFVLRLAEISELICLLTDYKHELLRFLHKEDTYFDDKGLHNHHSFHKKYHQLDRDNHSFWNNLCKNLLWNFECDV